MDNIFLDILKASRPGQAYMRNQEIERQNQQRDALKELAGSLTPAGVPDKNNIIWKQQPDMQSALQRYAQITGDVAPILGIGESVPSDVRSTMWLKAQPKEIQDLHLSNKRAAQLIDTGAGFEKFDPLRGGTSPVIDKSLTPEQQRQKEIKEREDRDLFNRGLEIRNQALKEVEALIGKPNEKGEFVGGNISGVESVSGSLDRFTPTILPSSYDAEVGLENIRSMLTTDNLGLLKGVLSDTDIKLLKDVSAGKLSGSDERVVSGLKDIYKALSGKVSAFTEAQERGGQVPLLSEPVRSGQMTVEQKRARLEELRRKAQGQ